MQDNSKDSEWFDGNVELYVDGELDASEMKVFESRLASDSRLQQHVDSAIRIKQALGQMVISEIPPSVLEAVNEQIAKREQAGVLQLMPKSARVTTLLSRKFIYPTIAVAASLVLLFMVAQSVPTNTQSSEPTQAEVDAALLEVKRTLALVSEMGYERNDIVNGHVVDPVQKAMSYIFLTENDTEVQ